MAMQGQKEKSCFSFPIRPHFTTTADTSGHVASSVPMSLPSRFMAGGEAGTQASPSNSESKHCTLLLDSKTGGAQDGREERNHFNELSDCP